MNKNYERKRYKYMAKRREIRNSTAEFLIFQLEGNLSIRREGTWHRGVL